MQHLDNIGEYDESDFDDYYYYYRIDRKKPYTVEESLEHHFDYVDANGEDQQLYTEVQVIWRVVPGSFRYDAPSDLDYQGYTELQEWSVSECAGTYGDVTVPVDVLTPEQFQEYTLDLIDFVEG